MSPTELAAQRVAAIADLEAQLAARVTDAQRQLYERLLENLTNLHADPALLPGLLAEYTAAVLVPLAAAYGQGLLALPGLSVAYFDGLGIAGYQALRAPLAGFLAARLGLDATGALAPGGYLAQVASDTTVARRVLAYAYGAQASGVGLTAYREGLNALVLGNDAGALGLVQTLYRESADDYSRADRQLQVLAGQRLGLTAAIYQGGLIESSRLFCKVRNGRVFLHSEIELFGTSADAFGGYTNKKAGLFAGKSEPYTPAVDAGGYRCRHTYHYISNEVAIRLRPALAENDKGELFIK